MKIIYFGTPPEAANILAKLIGAGHQILLVVTQPDRPKGRGLKLASSAVKELALQHALPIEQPDKLKVGSFIGLLDSFKPDTIVVVAYGRILPPEVLALPKYACLNVHASLLPKYRGAAPIQWALLNGEQESGVTVMKIDERLDTGEIIAQQAVPIGEHDDAIVLSEKIFAAGGELLLETLRNIERGAVSYRRQDEAAATYAPAISKESGEIDWRKSARQLHDRVRALVPWPAAHTFCREKSLKLWRTEPSIADLSVQAKLPGTIVALVKQAGFVVATGQGNLLVKEVQPAGGKRMSAFDFALGHDVNIGETLPN